MDDSSFLKGSFAEKSMMKDHKRVDSLDNSKFEDAN